MIRQPVQNNFLQFTQQHPQEGRISFLPSRASQDSYFAPQSPQQVYIQNRSVSRSPFLHGKYQSTSNSMMICLENTSPQSLQSRQGFLGLNSMARHVQVTDEPSVQFGSPKQSHPNSILKHEAENQVFRSAIFLADQKRHNSSSCFFQNNQNFNGGGNISKVPFERQSNIPNPVYYLFPAANKGTKVISSIPNTGTFDRVVDKKIELNITDTSSISNSSFGENDTVSFKKCIPTKSDNHQVNRRSLERELSDAPSFPLPPKLEPADVQAENKQEINLTEKEEAKPLQQIPDSKVQNAGNFQILKFFQQRHQKKEFSLSDFELGEKIGKGSFGDVYIAREKNVGLLCVLKKISKKKIKERNLQEQLMREIKIQLYLHNRHVTEMFGVFSDSQNVFLVMELMSDGDLGQKIGKHLAESTIVGYIQQVCHGLKFMHMEQVIHRDLKPQNLFLHEGFVKIGDFGCSIFGAAKRKTVLGSLAYISPQQLSQGDYDDKIDMWSVGVLAYELMFGESPFEEDLLKIARKQIAPKLSELKFPLGNTASAQAKDFIRHLLEVDPVKRMNVQEALRHRFLRATPRRV